MNTNNYKLPILYSFRRCPFAIRARAAIYFSNVKVILREVVLKNKPKEMLLVSEKATVPILVLKEKVLDESLEIIIWALSISDIVLDTMRLKDLKESIYIEITLLVI